MTFDELITGSRSLDQVAKTIQNNLEDELPNMGLPIEEIDEFVEAYYEWYGDCLAVLPLDLQSRFREEFEGTEDSPRIRQFLENPATASQLRNTDYGYEYYKWSYPYYTTFHKHIQGQRQVLIEAKKRVGHQLFSSEPVMLIERIAQRFSLVARQLTRRHDSRNTLIINDEFDVQDLFHALLLLYFDDVRSEEWTPSYAGGSSRIDFLLKQDQIALELKMTRPNMKDKEISNQLIIDKERYRKTHPDCRILIAYVYDPGGYLDNPRALENDLSEKDGPFDVRVIISSA